MSTCAVFPEGVFPAGLFAGFPGITSGASYVSIRYTWEENQVFQQYVGDTVKYPFQVLDSSGNVVETLVSPVVSVKINDATATTQTWTISSFDSTMGTFTLEVPGTIDTVAMTSGDIVEIAIVDTGVGRGHLTIQYISSEVTATGGGNEQVLNAVDYTFDAAGKTITLNGTYATLELPQILSIKNITKGRMVIYDCEDPDTAISYTAPVISWVPVFAYKGVAFANGDALQITVNKKT